MLDDDKFAGDIAESLPNGVAVTDALVSWLVSLGSSLPSQASKERTCSILLKLLTCTLYATLGMQHHMWRVTTASSHAIDGLLSKHVSSWTSMRYELSNARSPQTANYLRQEMIKVQASKQV